jgi:5'-phosphate synthase pdxT subunit
MAAGVLALQGDWAAHGRAMRRLGCDAQPVRTAAELDRVDRLILPGGESTAMLRLLEPEDLPRVIAARCQAGMPVLATCAGVILLARLVEPEQPSLGLLDVDVVRNAYGRQVHSSVDRISVNGAFGGPATMEAVFIRAPRITRVGRAVRVLGEHRGDPVLVRQGNLLAATFHPELTDDLRVHGLFCQLQRGSDA